MLIKLLNAINQHDARFRVVLFIASMMPCALLFADFYRNQLGFNPFDALISRTGFWAIFYLLLTLAITPLRRWLTFTCKQLRVMYGKRLADWNFLIKSRRMLGLFSFFYLCWHLCIYLHLELNWDAIWLAEDIIDRPFLAVGLIAWLISLVLALTSPQWFRRRLGKRWRQLHRLMYPLCLLAVIHILLEAKIGNTIAAYVYATTVILFLIHRLLVAYVPYWNRKEDNGLIAKR